MQKQKIREQIWQLLQEKGIAKFPLPCYGRIPNFVGSEQAAYNLAKLEIWKNARVIKTNPDSPQRKVRELALKQGKILIMATPRLKQGFLMLENLSKLAKEASSIKGAFKFGKKISLQEIPKIDLIITGSVAVTKQGARLGKGHGYAELEYAILRELKLVSKDTLIATTVHDLQIVKHIPMQKHDLPVDYIATPTKTIKTEQAYEKPKGIYWELIDNKKLEEIPLLKELASSS